MSTTIVAPSRNGHKPHAGPCPVPLLAAKVDRLHRLRTRLAEDQAAERQLTRELLTALTANGLTRLAGAQAVATIAAETTWRPVAELTRAERRAGGWTDLHPDDAECLQAEIHRPVLRTTPAPASKAVVS